MFIHMFGFLPATSFKEKNLWVLIMKCPDSYSLAVNSLWLFVKPSSLDHSGGYFGFDFEAVRTKIRKSLLSQKACHLFR